MVKLVLYTTAGCHLCEQAEDLLSQLREAREFAVQSVDISQDEKLVELYGIRIPVVRNEKEGRELGWPFSLEELASLF